MKVNANEMKDISYISYCRVLHKLLNKITHIKNASLLIFNSSCNNKKKLIRLNDKKKQDVMPSLA